MGERRRYERPQLYNFSRMPSAEGLTSCEYGFIPVTCANGSQADRGCADGGCTMDYPNPETCAVGTRCEQCRSGNSACADGTITPCSTGSTAIRFGGGSGCSYGGSAACGTGGSPSNI
jgi:hypothetical protein